VVHTTSVAREEQASRRSRAARWFLAALWSVLAVLGAAQVYRSRSAKKERLGLIEEPTNQRLPLPQLPSSPGDSQQEDEGRAPKRHAGKTGWRGYLALRVWPSVVLAWAIPAGLAALLILIRGQYPLKRVLVAVWAITPVATWWIRGRGREAPVGLLALWWLLLGAWLDLEFVGITITEKVIVLCWVLLPWIYFPSWAWFYKLRKLQSSPIRAGDRLSISMFFIVGIPTFAESIGGSEAAKDWVYLTLGCLTAGFWTVGLIVIGMKGPALVRELLQDLRDSGRLTVPWVRRLVPWISLYNEPSVIVAASLGIILLMDTFDKVVPDWLENSPLGGVIFAFVVLFIMMLTHILLIRPAKERMSSSQTQDGTAASTPYSGSPVSRTG